MNFFDEYSQAMRIGEPGPCMIPNGTCATCGGEGIVYTTFNGIDDPREECRDCYRGTLYIARRYHTLSAESVERLRAIGAGGGIAECLDCAKMIFVPGNADAGFSIFGFLGEINLKGVEL